MPPEDEELEVELESGEVETPAGGEATTEGGETGATAADIKRLTDEVASMRAAGADMKELINLGKSFIAGQAKPTGNPDQDKAARAAYGAKLKAVVLTGDDEAIAEFFLGSVNEVAQRQVNAALDRVGKPMAGKAGRFEEQMFLSRMADENPEKVHKATVKKFALNAEEREWLATASVDNGEVFLTRKYNEAAGMVLRGSAKIAGPRSMGGGGGGGAGGDNVVTFPGMNARESKKYEDWARSMWPDLDDKALALKIDGVRKKMKAEQEDEAS